MKILVNLFHPHLDSSRVNHAWAQRLAAQPDITVRDIYALYPEGRIDIAAEQQALLAHDRLVFQHPFYWYSVPPLMKQWLDDVLVYGWAYGPGGDALAGKEWVSAISTGGPADSYQAGGYNGFSMSEFLRPSQLAAPVLKTRVLPAYVFGGAGSPSEEEWGGSVNAMLAHISDPLLDPAKRLAALQADMEKRGIVLG